MAQIDDDVDALQWNSIVDPAFKTQIIYPNNPAFKKMYDNYFKPLGLAFLHFPTMTVFIDGQEFIKDGYTTSHIYAVEAHEIAHYILKHDMSAPSKEQEMAADVAGIQILNFLDHQVAKNLLITRFTSLYTGDYSIENNLSPKEQELLKSYLKLRKFSWWDKIKKFFRTFKK
jgi:hypothetical protein